MRSHALRNATAIAYDATLSVLDPLTRDARECFRQQAAAIEALSRRVDHRFGAALRLLYGVEGHVVVVGIGKSGIVGKKIAATLASTGAPSFFLHAAEAFHGDLGMLTDHDAVIMISYSGETEEVTRLLPHLHARGVPTIAIGGREESTLARGVDVFLDVSVEREVCPNNLAPTSSTLATLAMGDALAVSLMRMRGFQAEDFARVHPGGSVGRRLLGRVRDAMVRAPLPTVPVTATLRDCFVALTRGLLNVVLVVDQGRLCGIVTDAGLREALETDDVCLDAPVDRIMKPQPAAIDADASLVAAEEEMSMRGVNTLVAVDGTGQVCGVLIRSTSA